MFRVIWMVSDGVGILFRLFGFLVKGFNYSEGYFKIYVEL